MSNNILFIVEGEKDCELIESITKHFFPSTNTNILLFRSNIYQLYNVLKKADKDSFEFLDTFSVLKEITTDTKNEKLTLTNEEISEIYLFFDLDAHSTQARKHTKNQIDTISDMLALFNDELENGKMFISYPMVEAYKHPFQINNIVPFDNKPKYKTEVAKICNNHVHIVNKLTEIGWIQIFLCFLKDYNDLLFDDLNLPKKYIVEDFSEQSIYSKQCQKYISSNRVRVLSPFVIFVLNYFGDLKLQSWKNNIKNI